MIDPVITLLQELVAIDSVNPSLVPGAAGEGRIGKKIAEELRAVDLRTEIDEVVSGRANIVGVLEGPRPGPTLMLCGHMDTVGVAGMEHPFAAGESEGRLYGRGTQDMKGGLAAIIDAAKTLKTSGGLESGRLIVAAVIDEEHSSLGADHLVTKWHADAAILTEPTDLQIAVGHRGFSWIEITTKGLAAHGSCPKLGRDAIFYMGRVLERLESLSLNLQRMTPHPVQGTASLHASIVSGGRELSTYPDECKLQFERRTTSYEPVGIALHETEQIIAELKSHDSEVRATAQVLLDRPPFETPADHPLPELVGGALQSLGHKATKGAVPFWTDAAILGSAGIPTIIFGPGGAGMHSLVEYVHLQDVCLCRTALVEVARKFCGGS